MTTNNFGIKTKNSWYLIEDHTHIIGKPTWKIHIAHNIFTIGFLIDARMLNGINSPQKFTNKINELINNPSQMLMFFGSGKSIIPASEIRSIKDFIGKKVFITKAPIKKIDDFLTNEGTIVIQTSFVENYIEFK